MFFTGAEGDNLGKILGGIFGAVLGLILLTLIVVVAMRRDKGDGGWFLLVLVLSVLVRFVLVPALVLLVLVLVLLVLFIHAYFMVGLSHGKFRSLTLMKANFVRVALPCL